MTEYNLTLVQAVDLLLKDELIICDKYRGYYLGMDSIRNEIHIFELNTHAVLEEKINIFSLKKNKFAVYDPLSFSELIKELIRGKTLIRYDNVRYKLNENLDLFEDGNYVDGGIARFCVKCECLKFEIQSSDG